MVTNSECDGLVLIDFEITGFRDDSTDRAPPEIRSDYDWEESECRVKMLPKVSRRCLSAFCTPSASLPPVLEPKCWKGWLSSGSTTKITRYPPRMRLSGKSGRLPDAGGLEVMTRLLLAVWADC